MDIIIKIFNVKNKRKEINEVIEKISSIGQIQEISGSMNNEIIIREFVEKKESK